jgi:hypothetical protein
MGKYPFWMHGPGWYMSPNGGMRFSYARWLRYKMVNAKWHIGRVWFGWVQRLDAKIKDWAGL